MNIGQAATLAGVTTKTIRYYESVGLIAVADRRANNYRDYGDREIAELRFIHRARSLGFSVKEVGDLLRCGATAAVPASRCAHLPAHM